MTSQSDRALRQAEIYDVAVGTAMAEMTELANESRKATQLAVTIKGKRLEQSIDNLRKL